MAARSKTWWGNRFLAALEGFMDEGRLRRGRSYAQPYRRKKFSIRGGVIKAVMIGNINHYFGVYKTPYYNVEVKIKQVPKASWAKILASLGSNANWVTHLLLGEVPPTMQQAFEPHGVSLLPRSGREIQSQCSCPDWANPCKHVAGAYYHVASLLDDDPLLLLELRGAKRQAILDAAAKSRFGQALLEHSKEAKPDPAAAAEEPPHPEVNTAPSGPEMPDLRAFWAGKPLPPLTDSERRVPPVPALMLRMGEAYPEFWNRGTSFIDAMAQVYKRVEMRLPKQVDGRLPFND